VFSVLAAMAGSLFFAADPEAVRRISLDEQQRAHTFALLTSLLSYFVICVPIALAAQVVSRLSRVVGQLRLLIGATIVLATAYVVFIGLTAVHAKIGLLLVLATGLILFGIADAISNALASNIMLSFAPAGSSGRHASLFQTAWALASTVTPGIYTRLFTVARTLPWGFSALLLVASAAAYTALHRSRRSR
jgi:MFS family permease